MGSILRVETIKLQWIMVWILIILDAIINSLMGVLELNDLKQFFSPSWLTLYTYSAQFHSMFFIRSIVELLLLFCVRTSIGMGDGRFY